MKPMWKALKRHRYAYLFISPYLILFLVFQLVPTVSTIYYSFTEWNGCGRPGGSVGATTSLCSD